jgi:hypothetical protein
VVGGCGDGVCRWYLPLFLQLKNFIFSPFVTVWWYNHLYPLPSTRGEIDWHQPNFSTNFLPPTPPSPTAQPQSWYTSGRCFYADMRYVPCNYRNWSWRGTRGLVGRAGNLSADPLIGRMYLFIPSPTARTTGHPSEHPEPKVTSDISHM